MGRRWREDKGHGVVQSGGVIMRFGQRGGGKIWTQPELVGGETPTSCSRGYPPICQLCLELPHTYSPSLQINLSLLSQQTPTLSVR